LVVCRYQVYSVKGADAVIQSAISQSNQTTSNSNASVLLAETVWSGAVSGNVVVWNQQSYNTYVGTQFANLSPDEQTAVLMHEMAHPTTGYTSAMSATNYPNGQGVIDQPNSPYSSQSLLAHCVH
jgi:hypothetical protein